MKKVNLWIKSLLMACILIYVPCSMAEEMVVPAGDDVRFQSMILHYVNEYRVKHRLAPLEMNQAISNEAATHSRAMASRAIPFGHAHFDGRIKRLYRQFDSSRGGAENVAYYKLDAKRLVEQWIASPGHRQNIMGNYNLTGIGIAHDKKGWAYYTQIFLRTDVHQHQHQHQHAHARHFAHVPQYARRFRG